MAKGFRKLLFVGALAGAAYGLYCYTKKKNAPSDVADDDDDFEDFDDLDEEKAPEKTETFRDKERKYVNLAFDKAKSALDAAQRAVSRTEEYFNDEILKDKSVAPVVAEAEVKAEATEAGATCASCDACANAEAETTSDSKEE